LSFMDANRNHDVPVNLLQWVIYGCYINGSHLGAMSSSLLYWIFWELWCIIICSTDHLLCCWIIEVSPDLHQRTSPLANDAFRIMQEDVKAASSTDFQRFCWLVVMTGCLGHWNLEYRSVSFLPLKASSTFRWPPPPPINNVR
jgi:hypothetical protein